LEVYRQNVNGELPDFLDEHNSANFVSQFGTYAVMSPRDGVGRHPITRYCVELLDVMLPGIVSTMTTGEPVLSSYADYASCMGGSCICHVLPDRIIARQPRKQISAACPSMTVMGCECSNRSASLSRRYTGMMPVPLPFNLTMVSGGLAADYPPPFRSPPTGEWYSHPSAGRCPPGAAVGDAGCTWQLAPLSHSVYVADFVRLGLNRSFETGSTSYIEEAVSLQAVEVGRRAFAALQLPPCGSSGSTGPLRTAGEAIIV